MSPKLFCDSVFLVSLTGGKMVCQAAEGIPRNGSIP